MKVAELRKKTEGELQTLLKLKRETLRDLRFRVASKQHKDVREILTTKRDIAQILTVLNEKKLVSEFKKSSSPIEKKLYEQREAKTATPRSGRER